MTITHDVLIDSLNKIVQQELVKSIPGMIPQIVGALVDKVDVDLKKQIKIACQKNIDKIFESRDFENYLKKSFDLEVRQEVFQIIKEVRKRRKNDKS